MSERKKKSKLLHSSLSEHKKTKGWYYNSQDAPAVRLKSFHEQAQIGNQVKVIVKGRERGSKNKSIQNKINDDHRRLALFSEEQKQKKEKNKVVAIST